MINFTLASRGLVRNAIGTAMAMLALCAPPAHAQPAPGSDQADALRFDILEFVIDGNTVLPGHLIEQAVYPFLGEGKTIADAEGARKALEKLYQDAGYLSVAVELPQQRVGDGSGEVRLNVVEATVGQARVTESKYHLPSRVKEGLPSVTPGLVPNFVDLQDELAALSRRAPERDITPLISQGDQEGSVNVELKVQDELPVRGMLEINSKQAPNTHRTRLEASVGYDNLFQRQHSVGLYWFYSPYRPEESNVLSLTYALPLGGPGDKLFATYTHSNSNTPTALGGSTVSQGDSVGLRWRRSLNSRGSYFHGLTWAFDYRDAADGNEDVAGFTTQSPAVRYPSFSASYDLTDMGSISGRVTSLDVGLTVSAAGLSRRTVTCSEGIELDQFECKRANASATFQVLNLNLSHREPIYQGWTLSTRLQGQLASGALVSAEQFVQGGVDSVRGYYEGEQAGDAGLTLRTELISPTWQYQPFGMTALAFVDRAQLRRIDALPGEQKTTQMGSVGLGLRFEGPLGLRASLDWARVLFDTPLSGGKANRSHRTELSIRQPF